jgi:iron uptake system component EfeO
VPHPSLKLLGAASLAFALTIAGAACTDDGSDVSSGSASGSGSGSASGAGSGSGSGSASGISEDEAAQTTDNELITEALAAYKVYVLEQIDDTIAATTVFTDAVRDGDVEAAQEAFAPSRQGWEAIEPVAGLVEEIDGAVDARVDDFEGVDDPAFTGWHRIEYLLWEEDDAESAVEFADQLDEDLQTLKQEVTDMEIPPAALVVGASDLIEEVSTGKITGEEDRYSGTDLWDFAANVAGSEKGFELLTPALEEADPDLAAEIQANFAELDEQLAEYEDGNGGYLPYSELTDEDRDAMAATLAELSENLANMAGALDLESS